MTLKAKGSYFEPKHLEQTTLSYVHFIENAQAKPWQHYLELSQHVDDNYEPPHLEDSDSQDKEEGEEEKPLPIPDPMRINSSTPSSEQDLNEQFSNNTRESLERHLGTRIEETFRERSQTPE